ncbi:MAG: hypothetical protein OXK73_13015, partial [Rhodospirillaceae bacterium]|nr:hypothetical protein [Rhodospirillaceae bacterium]
GRGPGGPWGDQVRGSGRGRFGPMGDQVRLSGRGPGGPWGDQVRGSGRGVRGPLGDQVRGSGRGRFGPRGRLSTGGGLFRLLSRGLGPASAGAMMGLTAHDIATGAVPPDQVAPEVGGLMGGLGGSWMAAVGAGKLMKSLPGPIRFGGSLLAGLGGYMGGESAGRAASDVVFGPMNDPEMWDRTRALHKQYGPRAEESFLGWVQRLAGFGDDPLDRAAAEMSSGALEIGNWRGVGRGSRRRNRGRLDIGRNWPEVWTPPVPEELEPAASRRNRGRLGIGRNEVTVNVGPITVQSGSGDPREVAEEVADEIERRVRDRGLGLRDVLLADPTPEAVY